jgi:hypothetical protein
MARFMLAFYAVLGVAKVGFDRTTHHHFPDFRDPNKRGGD